MLWKYIPKQLIKRKNETDLWVEFQNGARIQLKGSANMETSRGTNPYGIIVDEAQDHRDLKVLYDSILSPILAANGGWIWVVGTPKTKGFFHSLAVMASGTPGWQFYTLSAETSGIIPKDALEEKRRSIPIETYNQEYRALFTDDGASPFRNVSDSIGSDYENPKIGHWYQIGVDLARKEDFTVITVFDVCCKKVVAIDRFNEMSWPYQQAKIESYAFRYVCPGNMKTRVVMDATGLGDPVIQHLQQRGVLAIPVVLSYQSKSQVVENLQVLFDSKQIKIPRYKPLIDELLIFESRKTQSGRVQYGAPQIRGAHDDCVMSLCLATWQTLNVKAPLEKGSLLMKKYQEKDRTKFKSRYNIPSSLSGFGLQA